MYKVLRIILLFFSVSLLPLSTEAMLLPNEMYAQASESASQEDYSTAFAYYKQAALRGHIKSQRNLATLYLLGKGTVQDTQIGLTWLISAAEQGDPLAQYMLALIYKQGLHGITINENKSQYWLKKIHAEEPSFFLWLEKPQESLESLFIAP